METVSVTIGKRKYAVPYYKYLPLEEKLIRVTSHPLDPSKVLIWRRKEGKDTVFDTYDLFVYEGSKAGNELQEESIAADLRYRIFRGGKSASAWDFKVHPSFRRKALGTALRETMLQHLKKQGIEKIGFPAHAEAEFYTKRGFERVGGGFLGYVSKLGVKPAIKGMKVLWQKPRAKR